jgi:dTDP-4-dehydrorhamnose 3,5-epimerase
MNIISASIPDVLIVEPDVFRDNRGFFMETYHQKRYEDHGIKETFVQDNLSYSIMNTLRGLHFQSKHPQSKLIFVISGEIYDVVVDIRKGSPTFGEWAGVVLSEENKKQLFVPKGFAHGFCVLSDFAFLLYKCSDIYHPDDEYGIIWSDPEIAIKWPVINPIISSKDQKLPRLSEISGINL